MSSLVGFSVFGVDWVFLKPFIVLGLALGGVYALSGVGIVVLYKATGVLNLAFGAVGAMGAFIAWSLIDKGAVPDGVAFLICILFGGVVTLAYGLAFGPPLAARRSLTRFRPSISASSARSSAWSITFRSGWLAGFE